MGWVQVRLFGLSDIDLEKNKLCDCCYDYRPHKAFDRDPNTYDEYDHRCKMCKGARRRLSKYGLSPQDYSRMLREQEGSCWICSDPKKKLVIDHDHANSKVRGLLCSNCNTALGMFKDSSRRLQTAVEYLKKAAA